MAGAITLLRGDPGGRFPLEGMNGEELKSVSRKHVGWHDGEGTLSVEAWQTEFERVHRDSVVEYRRRSRASFMRRVLVVADLVGLTIAFLVQLRARALRAGCHKRDGRADPLPRRAAVWILLAGFQGLYGTNLERADHSTVDELVGVLQMVTIGVWLFVASSWTAGSTSAIGPLVTFWGLAVVLVGSCRGIARIVARRSDSYTERTLVLGAGDVGQLLARKIRLHPEYGLRVVGFLDSDPACSGATWAGSRCSGGLDDLEQVAEETTSTA